MCSIPLPNLTREAEVDDSLAKSSPWARAYVPSLFELVRWIGGEDPCGSPRLARVLYVMPWQNRPAVYLRLGPGESRWEWASMIRRYVPKKKPGKRTGRPVDPNACSSSTLRRRAKAAQAKQQAKAGNTVRI